MKITFLDQPDASAHYPISDRTQNSMMYYLPWQQSNEDCKIIPKTMSAGFNYEFLYFSLMLFFLALIIVTADSIIAQKEAPCFFRLFWVPIVEFWYPLAKPESVWALRKQETCLPGVWT